MRGKISTMPDQTDRWGVIPSYTSYRGELIQSPETTIDAIVNAMADGAAAPPPAGSTELQAGRCADPPERAWGWAIQLYALRSQASWGIGDLADLRRFGRWAKSTGASAVQVSPLGAQPPALPQQFCPYYSSSRRFRNATYLRVEEIEGADLVASELEPLREQGLALNDRRLIDHDAVFSLKSRALELIFSAAPQPRGLAAYVKKQGSALANYAGFAARTDAVSSDAVDRVAFHQWIQYHLDVQLERAALEISLVNDIPVGFASDGFDAWRWQRFLAPGMRVGAPPDYFFPDGQDWGMPPFDPWKLRAAGFEPFVDSIRAAPAKATRMRLDEAISL